jgi:hypothetical protein
MRDPFAVDFEDIAHPENLITLAMSPRVGALDTRLPELHFHQHRLPATRSL